MRVITWQSLSLLTVVMGTMASGCHAHPPSKAAALKDVVPAADDGAGVSRTVITPLAGSACTLLSTEPETGSTLQQCPGPAGVRLLVADDDNRMSITVVTSDRREHPLDLWNVVWQGFSELGAKAQWIVVGGAGTETPIALVVSLDAFYETTISTLSKRTYQVVIKLTRSEVCVVDSIPDASADTVAKNVAPRAANRPCVKR